MLVYNKLNTLIMIICDYVFLCIDLFKWVIILSFLGTGPNITRNAIVNCTELVTYDLIKEALIKSLLMTGKMRMQKNNSKLKLQTVKNIYSWFPPQRWSSLPLHLCIWSWFLHYSYCFSCWCCEDKIHELRPGPIQQCPQLCCSHVDQRGTKGFLQGVSSI